MVLLATVDIKEICREIRSAACLLCYSQRKESFSAFERGTFKKYNVFPICINPRGWPVVMSYVGEKTDRVQRALDCIVYLILIRY